MKIVLVLLCSFVLVGSTVKAEDDDYMIDLNGLGLSEEDRDLLSSFLNYGGSGDYPSYYDYETTTPVDHGDEATVADDHDSEDGSEEEDHGDEEEEDDHDGHEGHDHGAEDDFDILLEVLDSTEMNRSTFKKLLDTLLMKTQCDDMAKTECSQCVEADDFFNAVGAKDDVMTEKQFNRVSFILAHYLHTGTDTLCGNSTFPTLRQAKSTVIPSGYMCERDLRDFVEGIEDKGCSEIDSCYKAISILDVEDTSICLSTPEKVGEAMTRLVLAVLECSCFLPKVNMFFEDIVDYMGISESGVIPIRGFAKLVDTLGIGKTTQAEEEEPHDDHSGHNHRRRRDVGSNDADMEQLTHCYSWTQLAKIGGAKNGGMSKENFLAVCPALIQQLYSESCVEASEEEEGVNRTIVSNYNNPQKYGYATASVTLISLLAFIGLLVFPAIGSRGYKLTMQFFIALGVGSLSGDAILHIIPEILGLHAHEPGDNHDHSAEEEDKTYIWKLLTVIGGIYLFYLFENSIRLWNKLSKTKISLHVHENGGEGHQQGRRLSHYITELPTKDMHSESNGIELKEKAPAMMTIPVPPTTTVSIPIPPQTNVTPPDIPNGDAPDPKNDHAKIIDSHNHEKKETVMCGMTSVGVMVLVGDVLHNFGDGLAIGVAFSSTWMSGLGTSIAIFCHELPHEFGDFAIYLNNGLSKWQALLANFIAACFAYIGCYIGLAAATDSEARSWMMAVIAGMFLYIALVDVLHEMLEEDCGRPILQFFLQNLGLCFGWTLLILIAYFEDNIINIAS